MPGFPYLFPKSGNDEDIPSAAAVRNNLFQFYASLVLMANRSIIW